MLRNILHGLVGPDLPSVVSGSSEGKDLRVRKIKAHSLTGRITETLMATAFGNVKRNRGAAGIDKVSITLFENNLEQNLRALMRQLKDGTFRPLPLRRVHIPKGDGKTRPLGIPAVRDRVAQEVLRLILSPLFERIFHDDSYGFRPGRGCHMAIERVLELHRQGHAQVLDADIKGSSTTFRTRSSWLASPPRSPTAIFSVWSNDFSRPA